MRSNGGTSRGGGSSGWSSLPRLDRDRLPCLISRAGWGVLGGGGGGTGRLVAKVHVVAAGSSESRACHGPHGGLCVCVCVGQPCPTFNRRSRASFGEVEPARRSTSVEKPGDASCEEVAASSSVLPPATRAAPLQQRRQGFRVNERPSSTAYHRPTTFRFPSPPVRTVCSSRSSRVARARV